MPGRRTGRWREEEEPLVARLRFPAFQIARRAGKILQSVKAS